jgi:hypothetical protein
MTEWASLRDGFGSAEQIPALLAVAAEDPDRRDGWDALWTRLYHQGTVYTASYAALPALAAMSRQHGPGGYLPALHLAASIIASDDGPEDSATVRRRYDRELADLGAVAARNLQHAKDDVEYVWGLLALMAFENGGAWQRDLVWLANGEVEIDCPCGEHLLLDLDGPQFQLASFADASLTPTEVIPLEPAAATVEGRLLALTRANDRPALATKLTYLFGRATCPRCRAPLQFPRQTAGVELHGQIPMIT